MFFAHQKFLESIEPEVHKVLDFVEKAVMETYVEQGHELTGSLRDTARKEVTKVTDGIIGVLWLNEYYKVLDQGVISSNIPYNPGSGQKHSKYIEALTHYFQLRLHLDEKEAKGAAFGLAHKHLKEGMPVNNGVSRYSKTGKRTGFFTETIKQNELKIAEGVSGLYNKAMGQVINYFNSLVIGEIEILL